MAAVLTDYFASVIARQWGYGTLDCSIFMADWVSERIGIDPMPDRRGNYSTEAEYRKLLKTEGGIIASCISRFTAIGMRETLEPKAGDVMLVSAPFAVRRGQVLRRPTGAICASATHHAVVTGDIGLVIADRGVLPMIRAWTFG
jgi:hypothetical protein